MHVLNRFALHQRVLVVGTTPECTIDRGWDASPLFGRTGTVVRLRHGDDAAWVNMDDDLPSGVAPFPPDDPRGRGRHVMLYPEECEQA